MMDAWCVVYDAMAMDGVARGFASKVVSLLQANGEERF